MKPTATAVAALSLTLALTATAQSTLSFSDPGNLRGERVTPRDGRELPIDQGALGLQQLLRRLSTRASLMLIVAHPDDEDGGMLTFYSRGKGARVATLTLTRGEGGQNAMTGDFEDALGLIRTQELLAADRYFGAGQMFGTEVDFGFSKTKEEAFRKWTHERVLYDAVRAVRLYRPLVLAAVFVGGVTDGHGQHQVSGEITQEVFKAAADPNVFPELTREGILPWAPLKVYARIPSFAITSKGLFDYATNQYAPAQFTNYVTGQTTGQPPSIDVTVHEGDNDPLLTVASARNADLANPNTDPRTPLSYVQFARIGLGLQKTQIGPGVRTASPGAYDVSYHRYGSRLAHQPEHESDFFDGIDTSLAGIASLTPNPPQFLKSALSQLSATLANSIQSFDPHHMDRLAPQLASALELVRHVLEQLDGADIPAADLDNIRHELAVKQVQLNDALALSLGLTVAASSPTADHLENEAVKVVARTTTTSNLDLAVSDVSLASATGGEGAATEQKRRDLPLTPSHADQRTLTLPAGETLTPTRPYFFRTDVEQPVYQLRDPVLRNAAATPSPLVAHVQIDFRATKIDLASVVQAGMQPVRFVPSLTVALPTEAEAYPISRASTELHAHINSSEAEAAKGKLAVTASSGWMVKPPVQPLHTGDSDFTLSPQVSPVSPVKATVVAQTRQNERISEAYRPVGYGDLPRTNFYTPAEIRIVPVQLDLPTHRRIGYLPGTGDAVADTLRSVGVPVTSLTVADLTPEKLAQFDTVVLGVRTYNAHPDLHGAATRALLEFARAGGNVVVQYQTADFSGNDAPYPLSLGNAEKVVDETDAVEIAAPVAAAMRYPNRIQPADFKGWIEERGHGFLHDWDAQYTALTETHDPGQAPQRGGLLTAQVGRGHWTYCAFALYRQLPEAVPGAFRLFVNLLGLADQSR